MPIPWGAIIMGGSQLLGQGLGAIGGGIGQRRQEIGSAMHAAKLDDIGKQFMNYQANPALRNYASSLRANASKGVNYNRVIAREIDPVRQLEAERLGGYGDLYSPEFGQNVRAMEALANSTVGGGRSTGLRSSINRELAASGRSAQGMLGASGALGSGAQRNIFGEMQGGALAQLAEAINQDELARTSLAGQLQGQAGQLNLGQEGMLLERSGQERQFDYGVDVGNRQAEMQAGQFNIGNEFARRQTNAQMDLQAQTSNQGAAMQAQQLAQQKRAQALEAMMGIEALGMQSRVAGAQVYGNQAFASPRYNANTGQVNRGK